MLPGSAILLNGVFQVANREIGGPRKIKKSQPLGTRCKLRLSSGCYGTQVLHY